MDAEEATARVLDELEALAESWSGQSNMRGFAERLAAAPEEKRAEGILAMLQLAFVEGAYAVASISQPMEAGHG